MTHGKHLQRGIFGRSASHAAPILPEPSILERASSGLRDARIGPPVVDGVDATDARHRLGGGREEECRVAAGYEDLPRKDKGFLLHCIVGRCRGGVTEIDR